MARTIRGELLRTARVTAADVERVEVQEAEAAAREREAAYRRQLLDRLCLKVRAELARWEREAKRAVPREVLQGWAHLDGRAQLREWALWLAAYRERS